MEKWRERELIGKGGNGTVYKIIDSNGNPLALKVLNKANNGKAYRRFKDEIKVLQKLRGTPGIIQLIDFYLPKKISATNKPYYIMPLATPIREYIKFKSHTQFYTLVIKLVQALVELHDNEIAHRDIKPENILIIGDEPVFSDFGLAHFPHKQGLSNKHERIGAVWTIAPEMKRISSNAQFKKADVYSFAKTLWILITGEQQGFEGQYVKKSTISIDNFIDLKINSNQGLIGEWRYESLVLLEELFEDATNHDPSERPNAKEFLERLTEWYNTSTVFEKRNIYEWESCIRNIFPFSIPENSSWNQTQDIFKVLKSLCSEYDQLNYAFFPEFGGCDLTKIEKLDNGNIILNDIYILEPERLTFESMEESEFSYFTLELKPSSPKSTNTIDSCREIIQLNKSIDYFMGSFESENQMTRFFQGSFIIVRKTSFLNQIRGDLDGHFGLHHERTKEEYKELVRTIQRAYNKRKLKSSEKGKWLAV